MSDGYEANIEGRAEAFRKALFGAGRVSVHTSNALGEYDTENFSPEAVTRLLSNATNLTAWVVGNSDDTQWRTWEDGFPKWTPIKERATRYSRREDAEAVHRDDEDAWTVCAYDGPKFECSRCGRKAELAHPNPAETVCHSCCEDHEYENSSEANWPLCSKCNAPAPEDYYTESGLDVATGEVC